MRKCEVDSDVMDKKKAALEYLRSLVAQVEQGEAHIDKIEIEQEHMQIPNDNGWRTYLPTGSFQVVIDGQYDKAE